MNYTNIKRKFSLLIVVFLVLLSVGCVPGEVSQRKAKELVVQNLEEKYGGEFEVRSVEKQELGMSAMKDHIYAMEVYSEDLDDTFHVEIFRDGSRMNDGYEELKYGKQIEDEINSIEYEENGWMLKRINIYHSNVRDNTASRDLQNYKKNAEKLVIRLFIEITGSDEDGVTTDSLFAYLNELQQSGYRLSVHLNKGENSEIINEKGLKQIDDDDAIEKAVIEVINENPQQVEKYKNGNDRLFGFFVGQTLKKMGGKANPQKVNEIVKKQLG